MTQAPPRTLYCLFDGTWKLADIDTHSTNIVLLKRALLPRASGRDQLIYYESGIGTDGGNRIIQGITGAGTVKKVQDGYRFLAQNYVEGDRIVLTGFSRGATAARMLAGFIAASGLLKPAHMGRLGEAWQYYRQPPAERSKHSFAATVSAGDETRLIGIDAVCVFDTVGNLGHPWNAYPFDWRASFHDTKLSAAVKVGLHAISIDDERCPYRPTLWTSPSGEPETGQIIEQVWFAGDHSDIGGGHAKSALSDLALAWMLERLQLHDLAPELDEDQLARHLKPDPCGVRHEAVWPWSWFNRLIPYRRAMTPHPSDASGSGRPVGMFVHASALARRDCVQDNPFPGRNDPANLAAALDAGIPVMPGDTRRTGGSIA